MPPRSLRPRRVSGPAAPVAEDPPPPSKDDGEPTILWRATESTSVFSSPLGIPVAEVTEGVVVKEMSRYFDYFDDLWVATLASDGSIVWLRRSAAHGLLEAGDAVWEVGAPDDGTEDDDANTEDAPLNPEHCILPSLGSLLPDDRMYFATPSDDKDVYSENSFNVRYQRCIDELLYNSELRPSMEESLVEVRMNLKAIVQEFSNVVEEAVTIVIREMCLPSHERTIRRHATLVDAYYHKGICLRISVDTSGGVLGGDSNALKFAGTSYRGHSFATHLAPRSMLYVPLTIVMTVGGHRFVATALPPLGSSPLAVFGPPIADGTAPHGDDVMQVLVSRFATEARLKPHTVMVREGVVYSTPLPAEAVVVAGLDRRMYLLNLGRLLPPLTPPRRHASFYPSTTGLLFRLRPELLDTVERPLSSDAFVPGASREDNVELAVMTQWIRDVGIPTAAAVLGFLEPVPPSISLEAGTCVACGTDLAEMMRMGVCRATCCKICPQCYIDVLKIHYADEELQAATRVASWVQCGSPPRRACGFVLQPSVSSVLHGLGVNLRFLYYVHGRLARTSRMCVAHHVEMEMVCRSFKAVLWGALRDRAGDDPTTVHTAMDLIGALLHPGGTDAESFWADSLGPHIARQYGVSVPFNTEAFDVRLVCERVGELTGFELSDESIESLATETPFIQLRDVHPVMKLTHIPQLCEKLGDMRSHLASIDGDIRRMWTGLDLAYIDALQPRYFRRDSPFC